MSLNLVVSTTPRPKLPTEASAGLRELVRRVASSVTFERSPKLRGFLVYVCRCAMEGRPEEVTEQQIGTHVYGRPPGYNPNEDNIVRAQARILRMKLEHHFINEGRCEPVVISIPKGQYLPIFESRQEQPGGRFDPVVRKTRFLQWITAGAIVSLGLALLWAGHLRQSPNTSPPTSSGAVQSGVRPGQVNTAESIHSSSPESPAGPGDIRIAAGRIGKPYVDVWGHRWEVDSFFKGGMAKQGPTHFFPPVSDPGLFSTRREAASGDLSVGQGQRAFQYDIPLPPGVYELRLYFADPLRQESGNQREDAQNLRHIEVDLNGHPLVVDLDPVADAGSAAVDVRAFKDVRPASDGKLHLEFRARWGKPAFVSAIQLTRGTPGRMKPIRISARPSDFIDSNGDRWSGDNYFIGGRTWTEPTSENKPKLSAVYQTERHGNFSYAIPVPQGSYTVRLHFLESFFSPRIVESYCHGAGCRIFDVTCNGVMLLQNFDVFQAAGGDFRPVIREFHGLHPNGQGKLLIAFSPKLNYGEVRAIEVIDESQ